MWTTGSSFKNTMTIQTALIIILEGTIGSCSSLNQRRDCSVECTSSVRDINYWNDLPSQVVTASSVNSFKSRLDNYWHQIGYGFSQA